MASLDSFSTELLLIIFKYLGVYDLCRLKQTCKRFNEVIEKWGVLLIKNLNPLVTNQAHPDVANRSHRLLSPFERLRITRNWRMGIYKEKMLLYTKVKYIPWLQLDKDLLWVSRGSSIQAYERSKKGINTKYPVHTIKGNNWAEVCRFIKKKDLILSGQTDGSILLWSVNDQKFIFNLENCHHADVNSVDMLNDVVVSGSRDNYVKIWRKPQKNSNPVHQMDLHDRVWSVSLSEENKSLLAIGTAGTSYISTVTIFDINSQTFVIKFNPDILGAGVLDMKWESPSTLWSCGYDGNLRQWDLRTGKCEQALSDPCGATVYCFEYDQVSSIVSGTQSNGRVVLWDTRQDNYVQMYFMECCRSRNKSSPIYSLSYDAEYLFAVTDQYVNILDFSVFNSKVRDYSNLFLQLIRV